MSERTKNPVRPSEMDAFPAEEAEIIWKTAARLQGEASERLGERSKRLASKPTPQEGELHESAFTGEEIRTIAEEAGISPEFVELAIRELEAEEYRETKLSDRKHEIASMFLGNHDRNFDVTRVIKAPLESVVAAMKRVFPAYPYHLTLIDTLGGSDIQDSVMVFSVPQMTMSGSNNTPFSQNMTVADLHRVFVSVHPVDENTTEVSIHVDMKYGKWRNLKVGGMIVGFFGLFFELMGLLIGIKKGGVMIAMMIGFALTLLVWWGYRMAYNSGVKKGKKELSEMLQIVDVNARTEGAFGMPDAPPVRSVAGIQGF